MIQFTFQYGLYNKTYQINLVKSNSNPWIIILKYVDIYNICVLPLQYKIQEGGIYEILFNVWIRKKFIAKRL